MIVQMPDGRVIEFPDSMSEAEVGKALGQAAPEGAPAPPSVSAAPTPISGIGRLPALAGSALAKGAAATLGLPGDIENLGVHYLANPLTSALGRTPEPEGSQHQIFPTSGELLEATGRMGLTDRADLQPASPGERMLAAGASGLGSALPLAALGPVGRTLLQGTVGGLAGEAAHELAPESSAGPLVAGALAGAGVQGVSNLLAGNPFKQVASSLGTSQTLQEAGVELQEAARNWKSSVMPGKEAAAWAPVDAAIPANAPVELKNFASELSGINRSAGGLQPLGDLLSESLPKQLQAALTKPGVPGLGVPADWSDARTIRTMLGDAMSSPKLVASIGEQNIKRLYRGITADLSDTAQAQGAGQLFSSANAESTRLHQLAEGPFARLVSGVKPSIADDPRPEDAAAQLLSRAQRGGTDLQALRGEIPDAVDELAAAHLNYSPDRWKRLSPEAKATLVQNPDQRAMLDSASSPSPGPVTAGIHSLQGMEFGGLMGTLVGPALGLDHWTGGAAGGLAGAILPKLGHAADFLLQPSVMRAQGVGAAGANPLLWGAGTGGVSGR